MALCDISLLLSVQVVLDKAQRSMQQQYAAIREALDEEEQTVLHCVKKEESRVLGGLEEKLGHLRSFLQSVQQSLHVLEGLADARGDKHIGNQAFIAVCAVEMRHLFILKSEASRWHLRTDTKVIYLCLV